MNIISSFIGLVLLLIGAFVVVILMQAKMKEEHSRLATNGKGERVVNSPKQFYMKDIINSIQ